MKLEYENSDTVGPIADVTNDRTFFTLGYRLDL